MLALRALAVDLADQAELRMEPQLADNAPDGEGMPIVSVEATATVDMDGERRCPPAHDPDRLESNPALVGESRRQQRAGLDCKDAFLEDTFQKQARIGDLELRAVFNTELG
jgi:hypothetical protein